MKKQDAISFLKEYARYPSQRAAAKAMGSNQTAISRTFSACRRVLSVEEIEQTLAKVKKAIQGQGTPAAPALGGLSNVRAMRASSSPVVQPTLADAISTGDKRAVHQKTLEEEVRRLKTQNKSLAAQALDTERVKKEIFEIAHTKPKYPTWLSSSATKATSSSPGVPILFGSDWHWGEVVNPDEIGGVNQYNLTIARNRLHKLIDNTVDLLTNHMVNPTYPGIIFALGGDMVSGNIHEELTETNEMPIMPVVLDLIDNLIVAIIRLKEIFGRVFLPCVAGNHGRGHKKPRAKESNFSSYDWLIYQSLDRHFAADKDVVFFIPDGPDALVSVYGHRYLFTHGNQFRGGDGMIGPLGPIIRGDHKKRGRNAQVGQEYDTLVIGHFHQLVQMKRVIINGSLIGYNEYAYANNFGYEPAQQALWITHPVQGITFSMPINVSSDVGKKSGEPWVTFLEAKKAA